MDTARALSENLSNLLRREHGVAALQPHPAPPTRTVVTSTWAAPPPSARDVSAVPGLLLVGGARTGAAPGSMN